MRPFAQRAAKAEPNVSSQQLAIPEKETAMPAVAAPLAASDLATRSKVETIEAEMLKHPQVELPVKHHFWPGGYARELTIFKDTLLTGKIHKYPQLNILSKGEISVMTEEGMKRISAPFHIVSPAGTKRIAYAHEDCVWTTIHVTELTDLDEIEKHFTVATEAEYLDFCKSLEDKSCHG